VSGQGERNIRSLAHYLSSAVDWTFTNDIFTDGSRIKITDADGLIERSRALLGLERKLPRKLGVDPGQRKLFKALEVRGDAGIVFWATGGSLVDIHEVDCRHCGTQLAVRPCHKPLDVERMIIFGQIPGLEKYAGRVEPATTQDLWDAIAAWYKAANTLAPRDLALSAHRGDRTT